MSEIKNIVLICVCDIFYYLYTEQKINIMKNSEELNVCGYKVYRHESNPKEKEFHDTFMKDYSRFGDMSMIVFPPNERGSRPNDYLTDREAKIVISTIQWLGSPVGQGFLNRCGFIAKPEEPKIPLVTEGMSFRAKWDNFWNNKL